MIRWIGMAWFIMMLCIAGYVSAQTGQSVHLVQGSSVTLRADAGGALSYLWLRNGEPINGYHDQRLVVSDAGTYTVMALGENCNSDLSDPVHVAVDPSGEPTSVDMQLRNTPDRPVAMVNEIISYQLLAINNSGRTASGVAITVKLPANVTYETVLGTYSGTATYNAATHQLDWLPGNMVAGQSEILTISVRAANAGMAAQLAVITSNEPDSHPADNEAAATVEVIALKVPNAFTPNGDGLNDRFEIPGLASYPENRLVVFNRWGNEVFSAKPYNNDWGGASLGEGTYYYIVELRLPNGHWQTFKGFITLVRNVNQ